MGHMVLQLIAVAPETQMFFGAAQMIVRAAPDPVIIRMCSRTLPHYPGNYCQRLGEWFHSTPLLRYRRSDPRIAFHAWYSISPGRLKRQSVPGLEHLAKPKAAAPSH